MSPPLFKRSFSLCEEVVPLVNGCDPGDRSRLVIEDLVRYMRRNAKASHSRHAGPAQIVEPPLVTPELRDTKF
jgi:hypothetical protein